MIYKGNICDGCGKEIEDNDDIVVCPECATPQHRECYNKNNCCVNGHLHAEGFEWKSTVVQPKPAFFGNDKKEETSPCPNCGHENPKGAQKCESCNMKLVVFGIDLADSIEKQNQENEGQYLINTPDESQENGHYEPPFKLGVGEGFESEEQAAHDEADENVSKEYGEQTPLNEGVPPTAQQISEDIVQSYAQSAQGFVNDGYIDGVNVNLIASLVGPNAYKYIEKFKALELGKKSSFNWAAFFFSAYWFFYRKLYKVGIIVMTVSMMISIAITPVMTNALENFEDKFSTIIPYESVEEFEEYYNSMTEEEMAEFSGQLVEQMTDVATPLFVIVFAAIFLNLLIGLVCGFIANKLYKKETLIKAKNVMGAKTKGEATLIVAKLGGTSAIAVLLAFFAEQILSSIASQLIYY